MRSIPLLIEAIPTEGYTVRVRFEDELTADVDLSYLLNYGGVFEPLRDPEYFRQLRVDDEAGTIVWPNQTDIAPETLYVHARQAANGSGMEPVKLSGGYRLPEGTTLADVRRLDQELLASEDSAVQGHEAKDSHQETPPEEE